VGDDPFRNGGNLGRRLAGAQDHFREALAQVPVRVDPRERQVVERGRSQGVQDRGIAGGRVPLARCSRLHRRTVPVHDPSMATETKTKGGLEDVVATSSAICYLDGERGVLAYCGYDIHDLASSATFEEVCYLLWHRRLPTRSELGDLHSQLSAARPLPEGIIRLMRSLPSGRRHGCPADAHVSAGALRCRGGRFLATGAVSQGRAPDGAGRDRLVATWGRLQAGGGPIAPDAGHGARGELPVHAHRQRPNATAARAFDVALILHADHELNASTFAARVAAATLTDIYSAVVAAIGTLKGPLHGGANADVMQMLLELGSDAECRAHRCAIRGKLARKEKIPGFGHRVYRTEDPRATHLRRMSRSLGRRAAVPAWFDMSQRIEALVKAEKKLNPNVDFYSASTYYALGIPIDLYTPVFAVSRMSGWTAHVLEQYANNRLIRPRADYVGPDVSAALRAARSAVTGSGSRLASRAPGGRTARRGRPTRAGGHCHTAMCRATGRRSTPARTRTGRRTPCRSETREGSQPTVSAAASGGRRC
jgi:citrate synthase